MEIELHIKKSIKLRLAVCEKVIKLVLLIALITL